MAREVEGAVDKLRYFAGAARFLEGQVTSSTAPELWDMVLPEPAGVAALIIPWNDPVDLAVRKLGAALAAGCTAVIKSSEVTPASTAALIEVGARQRRLPLRRSESPERAGGPTGDALVDHPASTRSPLPAAPRRGCESWRAPPSAWQESRSNAVANSQQSSVPTLISSAVSMP